MILLAHSNVRICSDWTMCDFSRLIPPKLKCKIENKCVPELVVLPGVALFLLSSLNPAVVCEPVATLPREAPRFTGRYSGTGKMD